MACKTYLVEILLPKLSGDGIPVKQKWFDGLLKELTDKFGGVASFVRAPGQGMWESGDKIEHDNIAVVEAMTEELDEAFWEQLREQLERELKQDEIVIRAQTINRL